ncbi:MAG TPA: ABC transporter permease, partial [Candidatus Sumerlaeota bacterium]|nr:ABC transporter permease [Candidatus Sumerlaeota bacterium]
MSFVLVKKVFRDLSQRMGALAALLLVVAVGVGTYVAMTSAFRDLDTARAEYYADLRLGDFILDVKRAPVNFVDTIREHPGVR